MSYVALGCIVWAGWYKYIALSVNRTSFKVCLISAVVECYQGVSYAASRSTISPAGSIIPCLACLGRPRVYPAYPVVQVRRPSHNLSCRGAEQSYLGGSPTPGVSEGQSKIEKILFDYPPIIARGGNPALDGEWTLQTFLLSHLRQTAEQAESLRAWERTRLRSHGKGLLAISL